MVLLWVCRAVCIRESVRLQWDLLGCTMKVTVKRLDVLWNCRRCYSDTLWLQRVKLLLGVARASRLKVVLVLVQRWVLNRVWVWVLRVEWEAGLLRSMWLSSMSVVLVLLFLSRATVCRHYLQAELRGMLRHDMVLLPYLFVLFCDPCV